MNRWKMTKLLWVIWKACMWGDSDDRLMMAKAIAICTQQLCAKVSASIKSHGGVV